MYTDGPGAQQTLTGFPFNTNSQYALPKKLENCFLGLFNIIEMTFLSFDPLYECEKNGGRVKAHNHMVHTTSQTVIYSFTSRKKLHPTNNPPDTASTS
jgi:hypothetical protein